MTLQAKYQEQHFLGQEEIILRALNNCKSIQTTAAFLTLDPNYIRQIALDNGLTDLVDLQQ